MLKNVTLTVEEEALRWARREAADKGISVSKFMGQILEREMRSKDAYRQAFERWKKIKPVPMKGRIDKLSREEAHARGR